MSDRVRDACEAEWPANKSDCSAFVRAVAANLRIPLQGDANQIVDTIRTAGTWRHLKDGIAANASAAAGKFVLAGLRGDEQFQHSNHGHVVIVVAGPLAHGRYPTAFWGRLGGVGREYETINWAWNTHDRDRVTYAECDVP